MGLGYFSTSFSPPLFFAGELCLVKLPSLDLSHVTHRPGNIQQGESGGINHTLISLVANLCPPTSGEICLIGSERQSEQSGYSIRLSPSEFRGKNKWGIPVA